MRTKKSRKYEGKVTFQRRFSKRRDRLFVIRQFSERDAAAIALISSEAFRDEMDRGMPSLTPERFIGSSRKPNVKIFVAEDAGNVVGFLTLTEGSIETPAQIHLVAVKDGHRGMGLGKELIRTVVEHVRNRGRKKLKVLTRPWNIAMSKVCIDLGFVPEAYLRRDYLDADLVLYSCLFE